jgi:hypothetical protein
MKTKSEVPKTRMNLFHLGMLIFLNEIPTLYLRRTILIPKVINKEE